MLTKKVYTSPKVLAFLDEYAALCRKHQCIILSEGEEIEAVDVENYPKCIESLWGVCETTERLARAVAEEHLARAMVEEGRG